MQHSITIIVVIVIIINVNIIISEMGVAMHARLVLVHTGEGGAPQHH